MIPVVPKLAPTVYAEQPGYRVGTRFFPAATRLSQGQIYSSATHRHQRLDGMVARADYAANVMPTTNMQVRTPVGSYTQPVNHYQWHFWDNLKWYWRNMRFSLPEQEYTQVFNQMGQQLPGQPMMMTPQPRYTAVINAPRYNTVPAGISPSSAQGSQGFGTPGGTVVGQGAAAMNRRRYYSSAPWVAKGPEFHG